MAKWIRHPEDNRETRLVPVFLRTFTLSGEVECAVLSLTAHGIYEALINGQPVTENRFTPGLTSYYHRIQVQRYDVTPLLRDGENLWQTTVGDGWWRWNNNFGSRLALWGELTIQYKDGSEETIGTDEQFRVGTGPILRSDLQKGETYDARNESKVPVTIDSFQNESMVTGTFDSFSVEEVLHTDAAMIPTEGVPMREKERFAGVLMKDSAGQTVVDFGQNLAGYVQFRLHHTAPGQVIHLKHGEGLDLEGRFSTANCDGGMEEFQEITYICKGAETEEYKPHFCYAGFRYVLVEGLGSETSIECTAIAVYSDMEETGTFTCSNPLINKLVQNALWSQKGNFLDVAVDCPTRERNAWTGDAQIYCRTAAWFMNVYPFMEKWLKDQTIEQYASGKVGITFPSTSSVHDPEELPVVQAKDPRMALAGPSGDGNIGEDSVGWGDSAVWIPYQMYLMYGNPAILEEHYETAKRWVDFSLRCMKDPNPYYAGRPWYANGDGEWIYDTRFHYGEWVEPLPPSEEMIAYAKSGGKTGSDFVAFLAKYGAPEVATAYTKRSCDNLAHMARILGKEEDATFYAATADRIKQAYDRYMIAGDGSIQPGHQAAYVRALAMDLVSEAKKPLVIAQLKKEIEAADYHLNTGFLSTVYLLPVLVEHGMKDIAFRILEQEEAPGWLHMVKMGSTTMLENWTGMDSFQGSFNHYSFGAVCQFLFEYVAGIRPTFEAPGFREFTLQPVIGGTLTHAEATYKTKYGEIRSAWSVTGEQYEYSCTVPEGTKAHLVLPDGRKETITAGGYTFSGRQNDTF